MPYSKMNIALVALMPMLFALVESMCSFSATMSYCEFESGKFLAYDRAFQVPSLYIDGSSLTQLTEKDFGSFRNLETLVIDNSTFPKAKGCAFLTPLKRLRRLSITNSDIEEECLLSINGTDLRDLSLQANNLSRLNSNFFGHLKKVESIDLGDNYISDIAPGTFSNLTFLKRVNLANNSMGVGFDPLSLSLSPSVCSLCDGGRREGCMEGCLRNTEVDALWKSLNGLDVEVRLEGNPVCGAVVDDLVSLFGRKDGVVMETEAEWDGSCQLLKKGRCPRHGTRYAFLAKACSSEAGGQNAHSQTTPTSGQEADGVQERKLADVEAAGPLAVWAWVIPVLIVVGVIAAPIIVAWRFPQWRRHVITCKRLVSQSGVEETAEEGESHPLNEVKTELMSQDVSVGITPAAVHACRNLR